MNSRKFYAIAALTTLTILMVIGMLTYVHSHLTASMPERYGFSVTCPVNTVPIEDEEYLTCTDGPDGMWYANVKVSPTTLSDAAAVVADNNSGLTPLDLAYITPIRPMPVDGHPGLIAVQFNSSESTWLAYQEPFLLVVRQGHLYRVHVRSFRPDDMAVLTSFRFTK